MTSSGTTGPFRRSDRLLDARDFRRVLRRGRRRSAAELVVVLADYRENPNESNSLDSERRIRSRLGITASRKVGNAVVRNRLKRRIRAWYRETRGEFPREWDLVVIAKRAGAELAGAELDRVLRRLLELSPREPVAAGAADG